MNRLNHSAIVALLVITSAFLVGGCDNKKDLTRERALSILKQSNMRKEGLTFPHRLGKQFCLPNVKPDADGDPYWKFMFLLEADGLIKIVNESGNGGVYWYVIATDKGAEYRNQDRELPFIMAIPEPTEVTSIGVPSQMGGNTTSIVNFRIKYKHTHVFDLYARVTGDNNGYSGETEARAVFALYDDGWHLEKWDRK